MKKFKYLLVVLMGILILPIMVNAEVKPDSEIKDNNEVKVYLFRGESCPHCEEAIEWFDSIEDELGDKFQIVGYETWENDDNAAYMEEVTAARSEEIDGVPYIIIGDKSWSGFDSSYKDAMKAAINSEYSKDKKDRYDLDKVVKNYRKGITTTSSTDTTSIIILIIVIIGGAIGLGVYYYVNYYKKEVEEVIVEEPKKESKKKETPKKKTTTTKKTTTKKKTNSTSKTNKK